MTSLTHTVSNTLIEYEEQIESKIDSKIICFKLPVNVLTDIDYLIKNQIFFSRSEIIRFCILNFKQYKNFETNSFDLTTKNSVSIKLSNDFLILIDSLSKKFSHNRTELIRTAISKILPEIYTLVNQINLENISDNEVYIVKMFKCFNEHKTTFNRLYYRKFFLSFSEFIRYAFITRKMFYNSDDCEITSINFLQNKTKSRNGLKMPKNLQKILFQIAKQSDSSESKYLRESIHDYLEYLESYLIFINKILEDN